MFNPVTVGTQCPDQVHDHAIGLAKRVQVQKLRSDMNGDAGDVNARQCRRACVNARHLRPIDAELVFTFTGGDFFMGQRIDIRIDANGDVGINPQ